jgi:Flp pilus assembly protein TadD
LHKRALILTAVLVLVFTAATALYARFGYGFVLRVYELQQTGTAEAAQGARRVREYWDYVRVDPSSLKMRGRLVDALIANGQTEEALEIATEFVESARKDETYLARLIAARAQIAAGQLGRAEGTLAEVVRTAEDSAEAHYELARIGAAKGEFERMRAEFARAAEAGPEGSTVEFAERRDAARKKVEQLAVLERERPSDAEAIGYVDALIVTGDIENALRIVAEMKEITSGDGLFWRGVYEEESGRRAEARKYYRDAARKQDPLGGLAVERLRPR